MKKINYIIIFIIFLSYVTAQQYRDIPDVVSKVGSSAANWLKIETGTRAIGMAGTQVAAGDDVSSIPYNPASLAYIKRWQTFFSKSYYVAGITHNTLAYGVQLGSTNYLGLHLFYLDSGDMTVTTFDNPDGYFDEGSNTLATFAAEDYCFRLVYAKRLTDRLRIGGSLKYIREEIHTTYMHSWALDLGSNFKTGIYGMVLGMSVSNFGPDVMFQGDGLKISGRSDDAQPYTMKTEQFGLPLSFRLGLKNDIIGQDDAIIKSKSSRLTFSLEGINHIDYTVFYSVGTEYSLLNEMVFLRAGTHIKHDSAGMSLGAGVNIKNISVDYAYADYGLLLSTHQFGIGYRFK